MRSTLAPGCSLRPTAQRAAHQQRQQSRSQQQQLDSGSEGGEMDPPFERAELPKETEAALFHDGDEAAQVLRDMQTNRMAFDPNRLQPRGHGGFGLLDSQGKPPGQAVPRPVMRTPLHSSQHPAGPSSWQGQYQGGPMQYQGRPMQHQSTPYMGGQPPEPTQWESENMFQEPWELQIVREKRLLTQAEAANSRALADKAQAEARSKGYDTELARIKQQTGASFPYRKRGRPAAGDDVQPGRILARGGKKRQKTGDEEVSDPNDPLVYRYIGTIVGNCLKGGVGDLDLYPIFGSESASEARFLALAQKFLPVKFPKVLEFQDEEELVKWFKGPWPQGELQGPLNKFKDSARGSSGAISTKLVQAYCSKAHKVNFVDTRTGNKKLQPEELEKKNAFVASMKKELAGPAFSFKGDDIAGEPKVMFAVAKGFDILDALDGNKTALQQWDNKTQYEISIFQFAFGRGKLRLRFDAPDVAQNKAKGNPHGTALAAEVMLVRRELAAFPLEEGSVRQFIIKDTIDPETNKPLDCFIDNAAREYYTKHFSEYVSQLPGEEPNQVELVEEDDSEAEMREGQGVEPPLEEEVDQFEGME